MSSFDAVAAMVQAGAGVAVMPISAAQRQAQTKLRIVELAKPWARRRLLIFSAPRARNTQAVVALIRLLAAVQGDASTLRSPAELKRLH
jgi:DNA-binding transcriptional LysR family regulator